MIESKFRGKRVDNGEWVFGYYFISPLTQENVNCDIKDGWFFLCGKKRHCISDKHGVVYEVIPESVGQYTGLKDMKRTKEYPDGQEIYAGDIVDFMHETNRGHFNNHYIVFKDCNFALVDDKYGDYFWIGSPAIKLTRVIGNISENPELLREE